MKIQDIENLAELAKIELTNEEKEELLKDMEGILEYVKQIQEIDVKDVSIEHDQVNIWREDKEDTGRDFSLDMIIEQFPDQKDNFVKVKKIL